MFFLGSESIVLGIDRVAAFFGYFEEWEKNIFFWGGFFLGVEGENFKGHGSLFIVALV